MIKILFICLGNICRSPLAEFYFKDLVAKHNLSAEFYIESAATSYEETGNPVHPGTRKMLEFAGDGWKELKAGKRNLDKVPDVADPWYTGNFDDTWRDVTAGCEGLLKFLD